MKRRWVKFKGRPPRFHDPAEAVYSVMTHDGAIASGCYWGESTGMSGGMTFRFCTFHTGDGAPIYPLAISAYRRE